MSCLYRWSIQWRGHVIHDGVEQRLYALILERGAGHDRGEGKGQGALADALLKLFDGRSVALQIVVQCVLHKTAVK